MEDLCSDLCFEQPQNINEFLIERLKLKQKQGTFPIIEDSKSAYSAKRKSVTFSCSSTLKGKASLIKRDAKKL